MHPRQKGVDIFLETYNTILGEFYERRGEYPSSNFNAWLLHQRVKSGRKKSTGNITYYHHIFNNLPDTVNPTYVFNRISCAKFVYVKDISIQNFVLGFLFAGSVDIDCQIVNLPAHADLKEFLVPEGLITHIDPGRLFNFNWL